MQTSEKELIARSWANLAKGYRINAEQSRNWFARLEALYQQSHRYYHTFSHVAALVRLYEAHLPRLSRPLLVLLAIFFHDAIYYPTRKDNEEKSATLFREFVANVGLRKEDEDLVAHWIMLTQGHMQAIQEEEDALYFLDFDLSVLGSPWTEYQMYAKQIRAEYSHLDEEMFQKGRSAVLRSFLQSSRIFKTNALHNLLEAQARSNLSCELASLEGPNETATPPATTSS